MKNHTTDRQRAEGKPKYKVGDKVIVVIAEGKVINQPGEVTRFSAGCYEILGYNGQQYVCEPKPEEMVKNNWQCGKCQGMKLPEHHRMCKLRYQLQPLAEEPSKNEEKIDSTQGQPYSDYKDTAHEEWGTIAKRFMGLYMSGATLDEMETFILEELKARDDRAVENFKTNVVKFALDEMERDLYTVGCHEQAEQVLERLRYWILEKGVDKTFRNRDITAIRARGSERREE